MANISIQDPTCLSCGLYKDCVNPKIPGLGGNPNDIKAVIILPTPEKEDDNGDVFQGFKSQTILEAIGPERLEQCYLTYMVKCPAYENTISRTKNRAYTDHEIQHCLKHLNRELKRFPNAILMTFGSTSLQIITGNNDIKISRESGIRRKVTLGNREYSLIPNIDPGVIKHNPNAANEIKAHVEKLFNVINDDAANQDVTTRYKLMNFEESIEEIDKTIELYKTGQIKWVLFDYETSVDLEPWAGGEIIMASFAHTLSSVGYVIPLYITNEIHHFKEYPAETQSFVDYEAKFPHNSKHITYSTKVMKVLEPGYLSSLGDNPIPDDAPWIKQTTPTVLVPDLTYDVPPVTFTVTEKQRVKLTAKIKEMLELIPLCGHNLKYDLRWASWKGKVDLSKVRLYMDSMNASFQLHNKGIGIDNTLKGQSRKYLNVVDDWENKIQEYIGKFRHTVDRHFGKIPTGVLAEYSGLDSYYNKDLILYYESIIDNGIKPVLEMVDSAVIPFADLEVKGIAIDMDMYNYLKVGYEKYLEEKREQIYDLPKVRKLIAKYYPKLEDANKRKRIKLTTKEMIAEAFNLNYPVKVAELVYDDKFYNLPLLRQFKSKTGSYSCNAEMREYFLDRFLTKDGLEIVKEKDEVKFNAWSEARQFLSLYSEFKRISKLYNDYLMTMPKSMVGNIYRTSFNLNGTVTGRLSSPFHSMPKGCDIKRLVTSRWRSEGGLILSADQSQLELRVAAALSNEQKLINGFIAGHDAHRVTASEVYSVPLEEVTDAQRDVGKTCNFAMLYGKTEYNLATDLGISVEEARRILRNFYSSLSDFTQWANIVKQETRDSCYVTTVFGRKIPIPQAVSTDEYDIAETERLAVNYRIQSAGTDLVTEASLGIIGRIKQEELRSLFISSVHDSNQSDVYPGELMKMMRIFKEEAQDKAISRHSWLICPLKLDFEIGCVWGPGSLKGQLEELSDNRVVFKAKGLRRDFKMLKTVAQRAYKINIDNIEESDIKSSDFADDIFVRDNKRWKATITLELQ